MPAAWPGAADDTVAHPDMNTTGYADCLEHSLAVGHHGTEESGRVWVEAWQLDLGKLELVLHSISRCGLPCGCALTLPLLTTNSTTTNSTTTNSTVSS